MRNHNCYENGNDYLNKENKSHIIPNYDSYKVTFIIHDHLIE